MLLPSDFKSPNPESVGTVGLPCGPSTREHSVDSGQHCVSRERVTSPCGCKVIGCFVTHCAGTYVTVTIRRGHVPAPPAAIVENGENPCLSPDPTEPPLRWLIYLFVLSFPILLRGGALDGVRKWSWDGDTHLWLRGETTPRLDFREARKSFHPTPHMSCIFPGETGDGAQRVLRSGTVRPVQGRAAPMGTSALDK